ncbi:MAG: hypothetical protein IANPNBLG_04887 [Bryobacteraceae bacterium]|nr:hypothetical protein [Bryobacteraceae bacterium]MCC6342557.1 hypothetical protein [Bryobacterales bacterium]
MSSQATYEDVNLILRLYELRREDKLREARQWFAGMFRPVDTIEEFNKACPPGSGQNAYFRMVTSYWEMAAGFVTAGVLNERLFFQSGGELLLTWEKIRPLVPALRQARKNSRLYINMETVAGRMAEYMNHESPESFDAFAEMVRNMAR